jgi:hypothetical protein
MNGELMTEKTTKPLSAYQQRKRETTKKWQRTERGLTLRRARDKKRSKQDSEKFFKTTKIKEINVQKKLKQAYPYLCSLDREFRPDFWNPIQACFVEIKMVSRVSFRQFYDLSSKYFPGYYFKREYRYSQGYMTIDQKIEAYPHPLLVKLYDLTTGDFITEKFFPQNYEQKTKQEIENMNTKKLQRGNNQ